MPRTVIAIVMLVLITPALARDDGRYAQSPLKQWFDSLRSTKGPCCSDADGEETEFEMHDGAYWAPIDGIMTRVPREALITEPNRHGRAMKWLYFENGEKVFRCFIPGAGT
jgi:hypothetical protein